MAKTYKAGIEEGRTQITKEELDARLSELLNSVNPNDILRVDPKTKQLFIGKEQINETELQDLKGDVVYFKKSRLWRVLQETMKNDAIERMAITSKDWNDVISGKMTLYTLSIMLSTLNKIEKMPLTLVYNKAV